MFQNKPSSRLCRKRSAGEVSQEAFVDDGFLGVDIFIQRKRGQVAQIPLWRTRAAKAFARNNPPEKVEDRKNKTTRIFSGSLQATMVYGAACVGIADPELLALRRTVASVMVPRVGGRSLALTLCLNGDPAWRSAVAPIACWGREIYLANQGNEKYTSGIAPLSLDDLVGAYNG